MSNQFGKPGYVGPLKPHTPKPMAPRGTVQPPKNVNSSSARRDARKRAEVMCEKVCLAENYMIFGVTIDKRSGQVSVQFQSQNFPYRQFEDAATVIAQIMAKELEVAGFTDPQPRPGEPTEIVTITGAGPTEQERMTDDGATAVEDPQDYI